jgi:hypothetical protein
VSPPSQRTSFAGGTDAEKLYKYCNMKNNDDKWKLTDQWHQIHASLDLNIGIE